jgi:PAS domain S-box-containing protein
MTDVADRRFAGLMEAAPDAMVCVERDGRIALVNAQAEQLFGYRREELIGQPVEILVPDALRGDHARHRGGYVTEPRPRPMGLGLELSGRRRDGGTFPAEISLSVIDTEPGQMVIAAVRDATEWQALRAERDQLLARAERDRLEQQLQQSQRLEGLGQLAGGVAHDFNNLLGVITSYAAFITEETQREEQASWQVIREDITQIQRAAERATGLTRQLLSFARQDLVHPHVLDLNEVVDTVRQLLERTLGEHIRLVTRAAEGLGPVFADPGQIELVLVNLAVNARDAMPGGGTLTIETATTDVDEMCAASRANLPPGQYVAIRVSDTGTGMPREVADRAFEPFFTTKPKGQGSGLGLATVYGIMAQAGGSVRIYSEPGLGTSVIVLLPVTSRSLPPGQQPPARPQRGAGETVLVVEDEAALREVTRRILARNGYQVKVASNGQEAVDAMTAAPEQVDILLTDVVMPGMQGKEVAEHIRALRPGVRVLFMSGYTDGLLSAQGVLEPGVNLIEKPFTEASLLAKLSSLASGRN